MPSDSGHFFDFQLTIVMVIQALECLNYYLVGGFNPSEKYEFVSWDYELPNMESQKKINFIFQTTNQP